MIDKCGARDSRVACRLLIRRYMHLVRSALLTMSVFILAVTTTACVIGGSSTKGAANDDELNVCGDKTPPLLTEKVRVTPVKLSKPTQ